MFNSETLEVAIGMVFLFLMMSIVCTAIREYLEGLLRWRAKDLEKGVRTLLDDRDGTLTAQFFRHPVIASLFDGDYRPKGRNLPSYIPSAHFATAFLDLVVRGAVSADAPAAKRAAAVRDDDAAPPPAVGFTGVPTGVAHAAAVGAGSRTLTIANLRAGAQALPTPHLQRFVLSVIDHADDDVEKARAAVQAWFDGTMDRVAGWYKRHTQAILFLLGIGAAVVMNVDALYVMERLTTDKTFREAVVAGASKADASGRPAAGDSGDALRQTRAELVRVGLPLGWVGCKPDVWFPLPQQICTDDLKKPTSEFRRDDVYAVLKMVLGWLVTAFAVMLGAPFWFDVLDQFMVVRSTVKPREKSREEASKDRVDRKTPVPAPPPP